VDPLATFNAHMIANGGKDLITPDGQLHADDPQVREAVIKTLTRFAKLFKDGYVPSGVVNWNDQDNNNSFHSKEIILSCLRDVNFGSAEAVDVKFLEVVGIGKRLRVGRAVFFDNLTLELRPIPDLIELEREISHARACN
jgi:hypothetical protein